MSAFSFRYTPIPRLSPVTLRREMERLVLEGTALMDHAIREKARTPHQNVHKRPGLGILGERIVWDVTPPAPHPIPASNFPHLTFFATGATATPTGWYTPRMVNWKPFNAPRAARYADVVEEVGAKMEPLLRAIGFSAIAGIAGRNALV